MVYVGFRVCLPESVLFYTWVLGIAVRLSSVGTVPLPAEPSPRPSERVH